jgi:hypothetical protein
MNDSQEEERYELDDKNEEFWSSKV